jgi:hypothetical protein
MKIALGTDHAGSAFKERVKALLPTLGHEVVDFGTHDEESCDYPDFVIPAAAAVARGECARSIVFVYRKSTPSCSRTVAYREFASGHEERLHRPVTLYSLRQKALSCAILTDVGWVGGGRLGSVCRRGEQGRGTHFARKEQWPCAMSCQMSSSCCMLAA